MPATLFSPDRKTRGSSRLINRAADVSVLDVLVVIAPPVAANSRRCVTTPRLSSRDGHACASRQRSRRAALQRLIRFSSIQCGAHQQRAHTGRLPQPGADLGLAASFDAPPRAPNTSCRSAAPRAGRSSIFNSTLCKWRDINAAASLASPASSAARIAS